MQFGFKNISTTMCSLIKKEVIGHYLTNGSSVCSCLSDATKDFDRLHIGTLFNKLLKRRMPVSLIRTLFDSYTRQKSGVARCSTYKSEYFCMHNGAKQ